jgi:uncharacterized membrane-anchored protein
MIFIAFLSVILIWLHTSSLRFIIRLNKDHTIIEDAQKLEESTREEDKKEFSLKSGPAVFSLLVIIALNLLELGYFLACVYLFNNLVVLISSSILAGYTVYSLIRFIPNMKRYQSKPSEYLKERTTGLDNILNYVMTSLEIVFCIYILVLAIIEFRLFEML